MTKEKKEKKKTTVDYTDVAEELETLRNTREWGELTNAQRIRILMLEKIDEAKEAESDDA